MEPIHIVPVRPSIAEEMERIKAELRHSLPSDFVLRCHQEVETALKRFIQLCNLPPNHQRLYQRLLLLSIIDAYHKGRFDPTPTTTEETKP